MNISDQRTMRPSNHMDHHPAITESLADISEYSNEPAIPSVQRQTISLRIAAALLRHVEGENLGRVLQAPCGIILSKRVIQADVLFVARERRGIIGEANLHAAPDLIVDVVSKAKRENFLRRRRDLYAAFGVREYWIVRPDRLTVEVLIWSELGFLSACVCGRKDILCSPLLPRFRMPVSIVFQSEGE
jgi:Uma2 family endonuclease